MNTERLRLLAEHLIEAVNQEYDPPQDLAIELATLALEAAAIIEAATAGQEGAGVADWEREFPPEWDRHPWANWAYLQVSFGTFDGVTLKWYYFECEPEWGKKSYNWVDGTHGFANPVKRAPLSLFFDTRATLRRRLPA